VHDLFVSALRIEFVPAFDPATVNRVLVDVEYRDPANQYERTERLEIPGTATDSVKLRMALRDKNQRRYRFRLTFIGPNLFQQRAWVETEEEIQPVS
jgi:hypothetical protein